MILVYRPTVCKCNNPDHHVITPKVMGVLTKIRFLFDDIIYIKLAVASFCVGDPVLVMLMFLFKLLVTPTNLQLVSTLLSPY